MDIQSLLISHPTFVSSQGMGGGGGREGGGGGTNTKKQNIFGNTQQSNIQSSPINNSPKTINQ